MRTDYKLELFHNHKSTCSQKVRLCLAEKELSWISNHIDLAKQENLTSEYLAINPNGVVPALCHNGVPLHESSVIVEYLDEVFDQGTRLVPEDPVERADMRAWMRYIDEAPSMAIRVPSFHLVLKKRFEHMSEEEYEAFVEKNPIRNDFFRRLGKSGFSDAEYDEAIERLNRTIARMETTLADRTWICGFGFSLADLCLTPIFQRMTDLNLEELWREMPRTQAWYTRIRARSSFDMAFYPGANFFDDEISEEDNLPTSQPS